MGLRPHTRIHLSFAFVATLALGSAVIVAAPPDDESVDLTRLASIPSLIEEAIADHKLPGAVVLVGDRRGVVYTTAVGQRALVPAREPMTADTIFDVASLTKVVSTTTLVMLLVEDGKLGLDDPVTKYIPGFGRYGKQRISIRHLLTHTSGLRPDLDLAVEFQGRDVAIQKAIEEVPLAPAGERFIYSDLNFVLLGDIIARSTGQPLERVAASRVFGPLAMRDTGYLPSTALVPRIAPTESCTPLGWPCRPGPGATMLRGVVHDPTARRMDGVAGHAGVFSTAADLARFCRMLVNGGSLDGTRFLSPLAVALMTRPATAADQVQVRGLGWDIDSRFASNRGDLFPVGSFGHTGWTGTSLWIDPPSGVYVVFMSNRVHPDGKGDVTGLRGRIASVVASAVRDPKLTPTTRLMGTDFGPRPSAPRQPPSLSAPVMTGIDVLQAEQFARLKGRRIGLVTNHTGRTRNGLSTVDVLQHAPGVTLVALFSPEHGLRGSADEKIESGRDQATGLPVYSLYGDTLRPTPSMLQGLDTLVVDLQDVGARFYTYISTVGYLLEEAAPRNIRVVILDRPNPVNGFAIEGPLADDAARGFTAYYAMPTRHGLTLGELARLFNGEKKIGADLVVVAMPHWSRDSWFDETGLTWVNPSPNMRTMNEAVLYPGIGSIEFANISVGRGTDTPFEQIGAPWIDGPRLAEMLNARHLPGIRFYPVSFTPASNKFANAICYGVFMIVTDRDVLQPVRLGIEIAAALIRLNPAQFEPGETWRLLGSRSIIERLKAGEDPADIAQSWAKDEGKWRELRAKYLLYY
jgi:uncharacterized protein YbbC (DUF1343 family)/CubicO group peptidase (beta-lactamase class C family)